MAYYTKINKLEFKKYLKNYSFGDLYYFKGINEGIENTNYFFKTKYKKCVLTIYENKITERIKKKNLSFGVYPDQKKMSSEVFIYRQNLNRVNLSL